VCGKKADEGAAKAGGKETLQDIGSDTMVNLAQAWAEAYAAVDPAVSVEVSGGRFGRGHRGAAERHGQHRERKPHHGLARDREGQGRGDGPKEFLVAYDGLAIYVHKDNPLNEISIEELGEIYREGGKIDDWGALGVKSIPGAKGTAIVRVSRQNNSGTYQYFREHVVGKTKDYKPGSLDMNGSKEVVELVAKTPGAIGYSGLGYATPDVKILKVAKKKGEPGVLPSIATVHDNTYPISRPLFMYTPGDPPAHVKQYIEWVMSDAGQKIVEESGYVPASQEVAVERATSPPGPVLADERAEEPPRRPPAAVAGRPWPRA
jgi:phosphate transport system substrate-binding protein